MLIKGVQQFSLADYHYILASSKFSRKGSTVGSIKETIALNWPVNMKYYDTRIKKFILKAVENGTLIQTKGKGLRGRFTVAGWKPPKKKRRKPLPKFKEDEEPEYQPKKTARDEDKEKVIRYLKT